MQAVVSSTLDQHTVNWKVNFYVPCSACTYNYGLHTTNGYKMREINGQPKGKIKTRWLDHRRQRLNEQKVFQCERWQDGRTVRQSKR